MLTGFLLAGALAALPVPVALLWVRGRRGAALAPALAAGLPALFLGGAPLMAAGAGGGASVGGSSYQITINAPAGADPQAIARAVSAELDRREGRQRRAVLSQMADIDG